MPTAGDLQTDQPACRRPFFTAHASFIKHPDRGLCVGWESDDVARMDRKDDGANFQIAVDGKSRSYRDTRETALEAGIFLKERHPPSEIIVRDVRSGAHTVIGWKNGTARSSDVMGSSVPRSLVPGAN